MPLIHASCVSLPDCGHAGVLIAGAAGSGKSSLALRLMDRGGLLVSDDQTLIEAAPEGPMASAPEALRGLIEIRGYGIIKLPPEKTAAGALVRLYVTLLSPGQMPEPAATPTMQSLPGGEAPCMPLTPHDPAAVAKIFAALHWSLLE
ncbi:MAG: HPr kinase/phosphatase C-terminal domain-containing protein [Alphaproteobacteria bacterium]